MEFNDFITGITQAADLLKAQLLSTKYSEDQPRDEGGRFASTGGEGEGAVEARPLDPASFVGRRLVGKRVYSKDDVKRWGDWHLAHAAKAGAKWSYTYADSIHMKMSTTDAELAKSGVPLSFPHTALIDVMKRNPDIKDSGASVEPKPSPEPVKPAPKLPKPSPTPIPSAPLESTHPAMPVAKDMASKWDAEKLKPGGAVYSAALDMRMTVEEYTVEADKRAAKLLENAQVHVRVSPTVLEKVLQDGRIKNQHETRTSGGMLDPSKRERFEKKFMGVKGSAKDRPENFPIYGYLSQDKEGDGNTRGGSGLGHYGEIRVRLKPAVRQRTTFCQGDSLDTNMYRVLGEYGSPTAAPHTVCSAVMKPSHRSFAAGASRIMLDKLPSTIDHVAGDYTEAQIYGGVKISDFDHVFVPRYHEATVIPVLKKFNIPHTVIDVSSRSRWS